MTTEIENNQDNSMNAENAPMVETTETVTEANPNVGMEKLLSQSEVNSLVGGAKHKGYQKGYQDALAQLQNLPLAQSENTKTEAEKAPATKGSEKTLGGMKQLSPEDVQEMIRNNMSQMQEQQIQAAQSHMQEQEANRILSELAQKVADAKNRYDDFDNVTGQVDFMQIPEILEYANTVDNSGDVLYDLAKNPTKIGAIRSLPPQLAVLEMSRLSNSIKNNQNGQTQTLPKEPLSQLKTSNIGTDNGKMSIKDYKKIYRR